MYTPHPRSCCQNIERRTRLHLIIPAPPTGNSESSRMRIALWPNQCPQIDFLCHPLHQKANHSNGPGGRSPRRMRLDPKYSQLRCARSSRTSIANTTPTVCRLLCTNSRQGSHQQANRSTCMKLNSKCKCRDSCASATCTVGPGGRSTCLNYHPARSRQHCRPRAQARPNGSKGSHL